MQKQVEYSEAIRTKYPEQVVIAIAKDKAGKANPVTLGWTMIASGDPPMMAIAVAKKHYSVEAITHSKCFTVAFPSVEMGDAAVEPLQAALGGQRSQSKHRRNLIHGILRRLGAEL